MQVDRLPYKDKLPTIATKAELQQQVRDAIKSLDGIPISAKPELVKLSLSDYKNLAKKFFLENFESILKTALTGGTLRIVILGTVLVLLILFTFGIL